jgi:class 3 adenylate cyclase/pimeloyl-ACP methyl ester carboxylesterase
MDAPPIRYARTSDGVDIAYWVAGTGPPLIYLTFGSHAEAVWGVPDYADWLTALSARVRLIFIDPRNLGLSSDGPGNWTPEAVANDIAAVATALGLETFDLLAESFMGPPAIAFAASHPGAVRRLVLSNTYASYEAYAHSTPISPTSRAMGQADVEQWIRTIAVRLVVGERASDASVDAATTLLRASVLGHDAAKVLADSQHHEVADLLADVTSPTLVLYRRDISIFGPEVARDLAAALPDAQLVTLPGDQLFLFAGEHEPALRALDSFLELAPVGPTAQQGFQTILFTDLEGSTALTQRLGDEGAQELLRGHNTAVRGALEANGGREVKHTGDGIMAPFPSAVAAVQAGIAIQSEMAGGEVRMRVGINAGEPIAEDDDLFGTAVQLAARITDRAEPGQVLVSNVVRELCAGKTFEFASVGDATMKGFDEPVALYEVRAG